MLERREYGILVEDIFNNIEDACEEVVMHSSDTDYIGDIISEVADSYVPVYNQELCEKCWELNDYVSEAQAQGLLEGAKDLLDMLRMGAYEYFTQMLYENEEEIKFNIAYDHISANYPDLIDEIDEDDLEELINEYDNNSTIDDIKDGVNEFIEQLQEEEDEEDY